MNFAVLADTLTKEARTLTYDFSALKGIIFGINTSDDDKMGPTGIRSGWAGELVAESQQAHQQAQRDATTIAARWPRTARLLREVADAHRHQARHWQDDENPID